MNILVIVNESPWRSSLPVVAYRFVRTVLASGDAVPVVFFQGEGVYNAQSGRATDAGTPDLGQAWQALSAQGGFSLWLCQSASHRRLPETPQGYEEASLATLMEQMADADRVVSF